MKKTLLAAVAVIGFAMGTSTHAELVTNGGFETGNLNGWAQTARSGVLVRSSPSGASFVEGPHTGMYAAFFGAVNRLGGISQTIATTAGSIYDFSFWYASDGGLPNEFQAFFDGNKVFDIINDPAHGYIHESFAVTASTNSTVISFLGQNNPTYQALDDVSVKAAQGTVPEPASWALFGLGLVGFFASRRKSAK